ncbi:MAG: hypothetical protein ACK5QX_04255 [bacterium]
MTVLPNMLNPDLPGRIGRQRACPSAPAPKQARPLDSLAMRGSHRRICKRHAATRVRGVPDYLQNPSRRGRAQRPA